MSIAARVELVASAAVGESSAMVAVTEVEAAASARLIADGCTPSSSESLVT